MGVDPEMKLRVKRANEAYNDEIIRGWPKTEQTWDSKKGCWVKTKAFKKWESKSKEREEKAMEAKYRIRMSWE